MPPAFRDLAQIFDLLPRLTTVLTLITLILPNEVAAAIPMPELTLSGPSQVLRGEATRFEGVLTLDGQGLPFEEVEILRDGVSYAKVRTDAAGFYSVLVAFPRGGTSELVAVTLAVVESSPRMIVVEERILISAGYAHTCAAHANGWNYCWGNNGQGQLGDWTTKDRSKPVRILPGSPAVVSISAGAFHTCAALDNGSAFCWGNNALRQLGQIEDPTINRSRPTRVDGISGVVSITAGGYHTCAIVRDGTPYCWGSNDFGQLGTMVPGSSSIPTPVSFGKAEGSISVSPEGVDGNVNVSGSPGVVEISAGWFHTCALKHDGSPYCWGQNDWGQVGDGSSIYSYYPYGGQPRPGRVQDLSDVVSIDAGGIHTCAAVRDGRAYCWGKNTDHQLGDGTSLPSQKRPVEVQGDLSNVVSIDAGGTHSCALTLDGNAYCWGSNLFGQSGDGTSTEWQVPVQVRSPSDALGLSSFGDHSCAAFEGSAYCWGLNWWGQLGDGNTTNRSSPVQVQDLSGILNMSGGWEHTCAAVVDRRAYCWGRNAFAQLGDGTTISRNNPVAVPNLLDVVSVDAGSTSTCAVVLDGSTYCWGDNSYGQLGDGTTVQRSTPVRVDGLSGATSVSAGRGFACAIAQAGSVFCWGSRPFQIQDLSGVVEVSVGWSHACARVEDGRAYCWGYNGHGQLGDGTSTSQSTPVQVQGISDVVTISAGNEHTCAVVSDGTPYCWGTSRYGQIGTGVPGSPVYSTPARVEDLSGVISIAAGAEHTCAISHGRSAYCWGMNDFGQVGDGTFISRNRPAQVQGLVDAQTLTGGYHSCAVLGDGTARCWGANLTGQLGVNPGWTPVQVAF